MASVLDSNPSLDSVAAAYDELRCMAESRLRRLPMAASLTPTELLHDTYVRLSESARRHWRTREHFFGAAALTMRNVLVDRARRRSSLKRDGARSFGDEFDLCITIDAEPDTILTVHEALVALEREDPRAAKVVEFRFFLGMSELEIAEVLGVTDRTVRRDWTFARLWLQRELGSAEAELGRVD